MHWAGRIAGAALALPASMSLADLPAPIVTYSQVATDGFFGNSINSVAFNRNNLVTVGNYQFIAFYDAFESRPGPDDFPTVKVGRRTLGTNNWTVVDLNLSPWSINDDHDTVSLAVDGDGYMHLSWGMHNHAMNYVVSNVPVTGSAFNITGASFTKPNYWNTTDNASSVTYPEFVNVPNSKDLLFVYRQGGTGGGSGNGDQYFVRYDAETKTFSKNRVINGQADSVNAYLNSLVYDSAGNLHMTWTWRDTPAFQTNHNIMYGVSPDNGQTWTNQAGEPYTLPITRPQAQIIANIPQQSTLINQTSMTLDSQDRPLVATWYAPGAAQGNHTRQYMLHYFDGTEWQVSQITNRPTEPKQSDSTVRELARPIVLVDDEDRVFVVMRYKEVGNNIVVAVSENRQDWEFVTLAPVDMGVWEPTYDMALWERENKLHLFYQQLGQNGSGIVSVLEWDTKAYFAQVPEPAGLAVMAMGALGLLRRRRSR